MENDSNPPRKIFPIPSEAFGSPSILEESLISDEDYTQPLTPASARIAYNNHVFKLHQACAINQPFRDLDSVLMKDWKDLHPRTKHMRGLQSKELDLSWPRRTVVGLCERQFD